MTADLDRQAFLAGMEEAARICAEHGYEEQDYMNAEYSIRTAIEREIALRLNIAAAIRDHADQIKEQHHITSERRGKQTRKPMC